MISSALGIAYWRQVQTPCVNCPGTSLSSLSPPWRQPAPTDWRKRYKGLNACRDVWRDIQDLEPPVEYVEGPKDLEGLILGRTFMEKMIKFTPASISVPHPPEEMVVGTKDRGRQRKTKRFALCPETLFWVCTNVRKVSEKSGLLLGLAWNRIHLQRQSCLET